METEPLECDSSFSPTRWTLVLQAGGATPKGRAALGELCDIYYAPVVAFIVRWRHDGDGEAARDQAHAFFESLLVRENLGSPDPERGRFRSYLLGAVKHFLLEERRVAATAKRGGQTEHVPLESHDIGTGNDDSLFDREWALALLGRALSTLEGEMDAAGKSKQFSVLKPWLDGNAEGPQSEAANDLGISETAVKVAIHRLRERLRSKVREEIASTLHDPTELDAELSHLVVSLAASSGDFQSPKGDATSLSGD